MAELRTPSTGPVLFYWRDAMVSIEKLFRACLIDSPCLIGLQAHRRIALCRRHA